MQTRRREKLFSEFFDTIVEKIEDKVRDNLSSDVLDETVDLEVEEHLRYMACRLVHWSYGVGK